MMFAEFEVNTVMGTVIDPNQSPFFRSWNNFIGYKPFQFPNKTPNAARIARSSPLATCSGVLITN